MSSLAEALRGARDAADELVTHINKNFQVMMEADAKNAQTVRTVALNIQSFLSSKDVSKVVALPLSEQETAKLKRKLEKLKEKIIKQVQSRVVGDKKFWSTVMLSWTLYAKKDLPHALKEVREVVDRLLAQRSSLSDEKKDVQAKPPVNPNEEKNVQVAAQPPPVDGIVSEHASEKEKKQEQEIPESQSVPPPAAEKAPVWRERWDEFVRRKLTIGRLAQIRRLSKPFIPEALNDYQEFLESFRKSEIAKNQAGMDLMNKVMVEIEDELLQRLSGGIGCYVVSVEELAASPTTELDDSLKRIIPRLSTEFLKFRISLEEINSDRRELKNPITFADLSRYWKKIGLMKSVWDRLGSDIEFYVLQSLIEQSSKALPISGFVENYNGLASERREIEQIMRETLQWIDECENDLQLLTALDMPPVFPSL